MYLGKEDFQYMRFGRSMCKLYEVDSPDNFYDGLVGRKVLETDKSIVLEFVMTETLGGTQRVQFYKDQLLLVK